MKPDIITDEHIKNNIHIIQGQKVMLDFDLAKLYGVETKVLNQAVKRNMERFPHDFMFKITSIDVKNLRSQFVTSSYGGRRYEVCVFTEQGIAMLSSVLRSQKAIQVNIEIMRAFSFMRRYILEHQDLNEKLEKLEAKYDKNFSVIFDALRLLMNEEMNTEKSEIGFKIK